MLAAAQARRQALAENIDQHGFTAPDRAPQVESGYGRGRRRRAPAPPPTAAGGCCAKRVVNAIKLRHGCQLRGVFLQIVTLEALAVARPGRRFEAQAQTPLMAGAQR